MPRHDIRRDDKSRAEEEVEQLEKLMDTYDEKAPNAPAGLRFLEFLKFPVPNKINELQAVAHNAFSARSDAFFAKRRPDFEETDEQSDYEETSSESGNEEEKKQKYDWKIIECYWFCIRQLVFSRIWILILQFIASFYAGDRFRTDAFNLADRAMQPSHSIMGDLVVRHGLAGLRRWDAQHFLFIADSHYIFEPSLAFFPGYPEIVNIIRIGVQQQMTHSIGWTYPAWIISGIVTIVLNLFFFHIAGFVLFLVALMVSRSVKRALLAVSLFAYNPASIFFTSAYTESMFCTLTFTGFSIMLFAMRTPGYWPRLTGALIGSTCFGLSLLARSNGILNMIFAAWYWAGTLLWEQELAIPECQKLIDAISGSRNERYKREAKGILRAFEAKRNKSRKVFRWTDARFSRCSLLLTVVFMAVTTLLLFFTPYIFTSNSVAEEFCRADPKQKALVANLRKNLRMPAKIISLDEAWERAAWCRAPKLFGLIPQFYGEIQEKYWGVGWFRYWKIRKIPCFLLMLPAAILTVMAIRSAWKEVFEEKRWNNIWVLTVRTDHMLPMAIHAAIVLFTAVFYINAEVFTRLIFSSSPFLYLYLAKFIDERTQGTVPGNRFWQYENSPGLFPFFVFRSVWEEGWRGKALYIYFLGYFIFGTMAHAAWLPFT